LIRFQKKVIIERRFPYLKTNTKTDFLTFQSRVENAEKESFEEWDDYIEWDAYEGFFKSYKGTSE
jgi:hypothetical protein